MKNAIWIGLVLAFVAFSLDSSEIYKWVDKNGVVHFSDRKPEDKKSATIEIAAPTLMPEQPSQNESANELTDEERSRLGEALSFESIRSEKELLGCWRKFWPAKSPGKKLNKIELYPFEEPESQFFCFEQKGKLYTLMVNQDVDWTARIVEEKAKMLPSRERYSVPQTGIVSIKHLDTGATIHWITSRFLLTGNVEMLGLKTGDLLMTVRNPQTGRDEYYRHLRRLD